MGASIRCETFKIIIKQRRRKETRINNEHERRIKCGPQSYSWISCAVSDGESILSWLIQWNLLNNSVPTSGSAENKNPNPAWKQFWNDWNDKEHSDNRKDRGTMEGSSAINSSNSSRCRNLFLCHACYEDKLLQREAIFLGIHCDWCIC